MRSESRSPHFRGEGSEITTVPAPNGTTADLSRGATRCLKLLCWYARRFRNVHPAQKKLAESLHVSTRQVRSYLAELRSLELVAVKQGGDGRAASYTLRPGVASGLSSGLLPRCFRAETSFERQHPAQCQHVADDNFQAERAHISSSSNSSSSGGKQHHSRYSRSVPEDDAACYALKNVKDALREHPIVKCAFRDAERSVVRGWLAAGTTVETIRHAIVLGCARKVKADLNSRICSPIVSVRYFTDIVVEVQESHYGRSYWEHLENFLKRYEPEWLNLRKGSGHTMSADTKPASKERQYE